MNLYVFKKKIKFIISADSVSYRETYPSLHPNVKKRGNSFSVIECVVVVVAFVIREEESFQIDRIRKIE